MVGDGDSVAAVTVASGSGGAPPDTLCPRDGATRRGVRVEVMVVRRSRRPEGRRDVTRCQEYKAGDKGDGGHICDS